MVAIGETYRVTAGADWFRHIYVVASDPTKNRSEIVFVNATSIKAGQDYDGACVLNAGDHPAITRPSYIAYARLRITTLNKLLEAIDGNALTQQEDLRPEILQRVQDGVLLSRFARGRAKEIMIEQGLAPSDAGRV